MSFTKLRPDGNGGYNVFDNWTTGKDTSMKIIPYIIGLPVIIFISLILPVFFWILIPSNYPKENHEGTIISLVISLLFFLDYWSGGILWSSFHLCQWGDSLIFFGALHTVFVVINLTRLFAYNNGIEINFVPLLIGLFVGMYFCYGLFEAIAELMISETPIFFLEDWYNDGVKDAIETGKWDKNPYMRE